MRTLTALAASGALLLALTGCTVAVIDPDAAPEAPETPIAQQPGAGDQDADADAGDRPASVSTAWKRVGEQRDEAIAGVHKNLTCEGELVLGSENTADTVRVDGDCEHLVVRMDAATVVVIGEVATLDVEGTANTVFVDAVENLNLSGEVNAVFWLGEAPLITETGSGNAFTEG